MRRVAIPALVAAALLSAAPSMTQTPDSQVERKYGLACLETWTSWLLPTATIRIGNFDQIKWLTPMSVGSE